MIEREEASLWRGFQDRFMQLAREEQGLGRADVITNGKALRRMEVLRAHCDYKDYRERVFVAEEVRSFYEPLGVELTSQDLSKIEAKMLEWTELEKKAGLKAPETGRWTYGTGAVSGNFRERVRLCVVEAGRSLPDYPKGTDPEDFWLHQLYLDLLKNNSDLLFCGTKEGGMILSVCVASATYCSRLERQALEQSEPGKQEIPSSQPIERGATEATGGRPPFDQDENLRNAILKKKARVTEIERILNRPPLTEYRGQPVHGGQNWRLWLEEERQHLLIAVSELEAELKRSTVSRVQNNDKTAKTEESKFTKVAGDAFAQSGEYRSVSVRGKTYTLTSRQAQMIQVLDEGRRNERPDVAIDYIMEKLGSRNSRWQDTWKSDQEARKALIKSGTRKGTLRLNL